MEVCSLTGANTFLNFLVQQAKTGARPVEKTGLQKSPKVLLSFFSLYKIAEDILLVSFAFRV